MVNLQSMVSPLIGITYNSMTKKINYWEFIENHTGAEWRGRWLAVLVLSRLN